MWWILKRGGKINFCELKGIHFSFVGCFRAIALSVFSSRSVSNWFWHSLGSPSSLLSLYMYSRENKWRERHHWMNPYFIDWRVKVSSWFDLRNCDVDVILWYAHQIWSSRQIWSDVKHCSVVWGPSHRVVGNHSSDAISHLSRNYFHLNCSHSSSISVIFSGSMTWKTELTLCSLAPAIVKVDSYGNRDGFIKQLTSLLWCPTPINGMAVLFIQHLPASCEQC